MRPFGPCNVGKATVVDELLDASRPAYAPAAELSAERPDLRISAEPGDTWDVARADLAVWS